MHGFDRNEAGKLFVGGLSWDTTKDSLLQYFSQYGEVVDCIVMKNQETGKSRGFGFVTYGDPSCVETVLSVTSHIVDGRQVDPKACNPKGQQRGMGGQHAGDGPRMHRGPKGGGGGGGGAHGDKKIFLGGLPNSADEAAIRKFFSQYGKVLDVTVMYDSQKQRSRGFGFLTFEGEDAVNAVCREHFINFHGKKIECKRATPRTAGGGAGGEEHGMMGGGHPGGPPPHMDLQGLHGGSGPPPQSQPDSSWPPQESQWSGQLQQSPPPTVGGPGQFPQSGVSVLPPGYQPEGQPPGAIPGWPAQQPPPSVAGNWPPGSVPPPAQPGMAPVPGSYMPGGQPPPVSVAYTSAAPAGFQPPPGAAPVYQYTASPPGQPPSAQPNGQMGQMPPPSQGVAQPVPSSFGYTAPSYAAPGVALPQTPGAPRAPGYQEFSGGQVQVAGAPVAGTTAAAVTSTAYSPYGSPYATSPPGGGVPQTVVDPYSAQQGVPPPSGVQVAGVPGHPASSQAHGLQVAAYGSTPVPPPQAVPGAADPATPKSVDYSSYYSAYGYTVEGQPGAPASASATGYQPSVGVAPPPSAGVAPTSAQSPYGSPPPEPAAGAAPQGGYGAAPGPSPTYQRQGGGQGYHPYARR